MKDNETKEIEKFGQLQENGILIKHIPVKGGHLFWTEDISALLDQYQDIQEQVKPHIH